MASKKGFELSLNMIITVILALVFLGAAIFFIQKYMNPVLPPIPSACEIYPPTSDDPVCVNTEYTLERGKTTPIEVAFYNDEDADIPSSMSPTITCGPNSEGKPLGIVVSSVGMTLPISESKDYIVSVKVPKDAARGTYICVLKLSSTERQFSIRI
jgi:hypothetical protein